MFGSSSNVGSASGPSVKISSVGSNGGSSGKSSLVPAAEPLVDYESKVKEIYGMLGKGDEEELKESAFNEALNFCKKDVMKTLTFLV